MNTSIPTLSALLLIGAMSSAACGDDEESTQPTPGGDSGAPDGGSPAPVDSGTTPPTDGGTTTPPSDGGTAPMLTACPAPTVDMGTTCGLTFSQTSPLKVSVTLAPVTGKLGYLLQGGVFVGEDVGGGATPEAGKAAVTLTIAPGTTLIGESPLSFLLINRGSKIMAEGTATTPIVMTSVQVAAGMAGAPGQWGGLIINGRAPSNQGTAVMGEANTGIYGGTDPADNSGKLRFVRLEFTGGKVSDTNELNGIAFQGVGTGTEVDFIHSHGSDDDAFEWFGGTVNAKHLLATGYGDDGLDWTDGYTGKIQYAVVQQYPRVSSSDPNGIEADNRNMTPLVTPISNPTLSNITLIGGNAVSAGKGMHLRRGTKAKIHNAVVLNFGKSCVHIDGAESQGYVGTDLALFNSRISCATSYEASAMVPSQMFVEGPAGMNMVVPAGTAVLTDPTNTATPNFAPAAGGPAASGGVVPAGDAFFTAETAIGGVGADDWTKGAWVKVTPIM